MLKQNQRKLALCLGFFLSLATTSQSVCFASENQPELLNDLPVAHISSNTLNKIFKDTIKSSAKGSFDKQLPSEDFDVRLQNDSATVTTQPVSSDAAKPELAETAPPPVNELPPPAPIDKLEIHNTSLDSPRALSEANADQTLQQFKMPVPLSSDLTPANQNTIQTAAILSLPLPKPGAIGPIVIDNDESVETAATIKYEDLPTDKGKTVITAGARFPVVITSEITSKSANQGDPLQARLKYDLKIGDRLIAKKGSLVNGHLTYVLRARSAMHSLVSPERWYRNSGALKLAFDEIINERGEHLPLVAKPARQARIIRNKGDGRELGVNDEGIVTGPWSQQLRYKAVRIGLNAAMAPCGVFSFGAMPVALGLLGAANPSFAFMKPVGLNVRHRRIKGFAWGFLSGIPGSWIVEDTVVKGQEAVVKPGDEFYAEFNAEFNGQPSSDASLIPGANTKVHGQVMPHKHR